MKEKRLRITAYLAAAGGLLVLLCAVYAALGFWPLGGTSVITGDLNGQYIPFYAHFYRALHGGTSFWYTDAAGMGGSTFALFAYYFASSFAWLYLLVPPLYYAQLSNLVWALKLLCAALAFLWYLGRHYGGQRSLWVPLSWCYALMGFCTAYAQNVMWLDAVILLPLVCAGLDALVRRGRTAPFALALAAAIFTNFYMGYMLCLFSVLYFVWALAGGLPAAAENTAAQEDITEKPHGAAVARCAACETAAGSRAEAGRAPCGMPPRVLAGRCVRFAAGGACAAALAGAVLVPAVREILTVKSSASHEAAGFSFSLVRLIARFFTGDFVWKDVQQGLPLVYCGMLGLLGAVLYFTARIPVRRKAAAAGLTALLVLSLWWAPLNLVWHAFTVPNWFGYRQSFVLVFFLLLLGAEGLYAPHCRRGWAGAAVALAALALAALLWPGSGLSRRRWLAACTVLGALALCLWLRGRLAQRAALRRALALCAALACGAELTVNTIWVQRCFERYSAADYTAFVQAGSETAAAAAAADSGVWRAEKTFYRTLNDPLLLGYRGLTHFSSTQQGTSALLMMTLGYHNFGSCYGYFGGSTAAADSLLGVRYWFADGNDAPSSTFSPSGLDAPWQIYENKNALGPALLVPAAAAQAAPDETGDTFVWQETLYSALLGRPAGLFTAVQAAGGPNSYTVTVPQDGILYAVFTGGSEETKLTVDGQAYPDLFTNERTSGSVIDLGRRSAGDTVQITLGEGVSGASFAVLDEEALAAACSALRAQQPEIEQWTDGSITLDVSAGGGLLLLTLPYDANWQAEADGTAVPVLSAAGGFLAAALPEGSRTVTLRYVQPGLGAGLALSAAGLAALAVLGIGERRSRRKEKT